MSAASAGHTSLTDTVMSYSWFTVAGCMLVVIASPVEAQRELLALRNDRVRLDSIGAAYKRMRDSVAATRVGCACPQAQGETSSSSVRIEFGADRWEISPEGRAALDRTIPRLRSTPTERVIITPAESDEESLVSRRGQAARRYLIAAGIDERRLSISSRKRASSSTDPAFEIVMAGERRRTP